MQTHFVVLVDLDYTGGFLTQLERLGAAFDIVGRRRYADTIAPRLADRGEWLEEPDFNVATLCAAVTTIAARRQLATAQIRLLSLREKSVELLAAVALETGCIGLPVRTALLFRDKWEMINEAARIGVPVPRTCLGSDVHPLLVDFPDAGVFTKPRLGSQSVGVARYLSSTELQRAIAACSSPQDVIVQEFVPGPVFFFDAVRRQGRNVVSCAGKHLVPLAEAGRSARRFVSTWAADGFRPEFAKLRSLHDRVADAFGADEACTHIEMFERDGEPILCEAAIRPPGLRVLPLQSALWGWSAPEFHAAHLCGADLPTTSDAARPFVGLIDFTPEGRVRWHTPIGDLVDPDVILARSWPVAAVEGGSYTQPLARLMFRKPSATACEALLTRLSRQFDYVLDETA